MSGFLYFLPNVVSPVNENLGKLKPEVTGEYYLSHVLEGRMQSPDQTVVHHCAGPGGQEGHLLYPKPHADNDLPFIGFRDDLQQWFRFQNFHIGVVKDSLPTPHDLEKPVQLFGYKISDAHDQQWNAPVIRSPNPKAISLPVVHSFSPNGEYVAGRRSQDEELWELGGKMRDVIRSGNEISDAEISKAAIRFLQLNYYIGIPEVMCFHQLGIELLTSSFVLQIVGCAIDWQKADELEKKTTESQ